jgi:hypothetical protein
MAKAKLDSMGVKYVNIDVTEEGEASDQVSMQNYSNMICTYVFLHIYLFK